MTIPVYVKAGFNYRLMFPQNQFEPTNQLIILRYFVLNVEISTYCPLKFNPAMKGNADSAGGKLKSGLSHVAFFILCSIQTAQGTEAGGYLFHALLTGMPLALCVVLI